jgi:hypothetical protein
MVRCMHSRHVVVLDVVVLAQDNLSRHVRENFQISLRSIHGLFWNPENYPREAFGKHLREELLKEI